MEIFYKVKKTLNKHSMLIGGERVLVALSGGPDSVFLLHTLNNFKKELKLSLHAIYIDHGLRPNETPIEIEFCKKLCESLNLPFIAKSIDVKSFAKEKSMNMQEAARELRYMALEETAFEIKADKIALGHTADDQAETLLMRLLRGAGPLGLSGIPPVRGMIIRPLIEVEREEINGYLQRESIDHIVDSSNLKREYIRNKIRLSLIPIMKEINPNIIGTLSLTTSIFREEERHFEVIVAKTLMRLVSRKSDSCIELFLSPLEVMDKVILRRVLRKAIEETKGLRGISFFHIEDIIDLIRYGRTGGRLYLPKGVRVIKDYSTLIFTAEPPVKLSSYNLEVPGEVNLKEIELLIKTSIFENRESGPQTGVSSDIALFDAERLSYPLTIRSRKNGDYFYPFGFGKKKKLQDFFVDEKVPRDERDEVPLILSGDDIIWVAGYRQDDRFRVNEKTKKILKIELKK
ncbi:MAG: tRNA lysidine(34) synthetase TilS [Nitrospirae bacterium]|nr:tRNA lysidine(34) synthetase TilS [Nitrospirota bacterium]